MNRMVKVGAAALALTLAGCSIVYSPTPVGDELVKLSPDDWNGTWVGDDAAVTIQVTNGDSGIVRLAWFDMFPSGRPVPRVSAGYVRRSGPWMFGSVPDEDQPGRFVWGLLDKNGGRLLFWAPDPDRFATLVEARKWPGTVGNTAPGDAPIDRRPSGDVMLGRLGAKEWKALMADERPTLFKWEEPGVLLRVGK